MRIAVKIKQRSCWHYAARIEPAMASVIVTFDMRKIYRGIDVGMPIERARIVPESWVRHERPFITFEVREINGIEPHERREQTDIRLGHRFTDKVSLAGETV